MIFLHLTKSLKAELQATFYILQVFDRRLQQKYYLEFYLDFFGLRLPNDRVHRACYELNKGKLLSRLS